MEDYIGSDLHTKQHCEAYRYTKLKLNVDKEPLTHELQKQLSQDKKIGESFFKQGELRLLHGDSSGIQFFELALQLDPTNPKLHYDQGLSLLEFGSEKGKEKILLLAAKRFKSCVKLNPAYFEGWHAWGNVLFVLGKTTGEHHYLLEAEIKYKKTISLCKGQPHDILADLYWSYGSIWHALSTRSKEPSDMLLALGAFQKAHQYQDDLPVEFWHTYGYTCLDLALHVNDLRYFNQGVHCFKNAVSLNISSFESWQYLGKALSALYSFTHDEDHFVQANECYTTAAQLNSTNAELWFYWASLLNASGTLIKDSKRVRSAIEKCHRAHDIDQHNPLIIGIWSEALATLGLLTDKVNYIHDAQNKVDELDHQDLKRHPELFYSYGYTFFCLGQYFNDLDYFYQSIEKFQEGLSLDRTHHKLWHALGCSYTHAAQLDEDDEHIFDKAHRFYQKALSLHGNSLYYFDYGYSLLTASEIIQDQKLLESALDCFERALNLQKDAIYLHPDWLFYYGVTLDHLAAVQEDQELYKKALDILGHVLIIDPEHPKIHYQLALVYSHFAEISPNDLPYQKAFYHYRLAYKRDEENDQILLDWAITLAAFGDHLQAPPESLSFFREAEFKMTQAAKLGNIHAYYHLACLYSLLGHQDKAFHFIQKADDFDALPPISELMEDDWLDNLKHHPKFQNFIAYLESRASTEE
jgi:tetratricopeptide (TPR) repeat protein